MSGNAMKYIYSMHHKTVKHAEGMLKRLIKAGVLTNEDKPCVVQYTKGQYAIQLETRK